MRKQDENKLKERVIRAAEGALEDHNYVSPIDVLEGIQLLCRSHIERWRRGREECLEQVMQGSGRKIIRSLQLYQEWAREHGLQPMEVEYKRIGRSGSVDLRFTGEGDPDMERVFRTHYVPAGTPPEQKQKLSKPPDRVVFLILRDSRYSECGVELERGSFLYKDAEEPLCLGCGGLGDLEYLPAGNATLTRRARKHSERSAVVVQFSWSRKRYERQGVLVEPEALSRAEVECELDSGERAEQRAKAAKARVKQDAKLVEEMTARIRELFPGCPPKEARMIAARTAIRGSGRVGRTAAGRALNEEAMTLAVCAAIRHQHTKYDELLARGEDRLAARARVRERLEEILDAWRSGAG